MAKKLTKSKAREILHDKEVHGHPLTEKQRKFFGAIAGGAKPYQDGGWLDKYDAPQAQNGIEGTMGGLTDKGFNYNGAWGGPSMQGGGYVDSVLNANKNLDWVQRLYEKKTPSIQVPGQKGRSTHLMESADGRVYPTVVRMPGGKLKYLGKDAYNYADSTKTYIQFPSDKEAQWFGKNYKKGTGVLKGFQTGGNIQPAMAGANTSVSMAQLGDSVKPIPMQLAMGGSMPGTVGFMYARTQSPAPDNGPYAKKTKASAQNGQEMKYYQEGLDFKPKTISQNGSKTLPNVNLTLNQKEPVYVSDPNDPRLRAYQDSLTAYNVGKEVAQGIGRGYDKYYQENWNRSRNRNDYEKYFVKNYEAGKLKYPLGGNDRIFGSEASRKLNEKDIKELATYDKNFSKLLKLKVRPQSALYSAELPPIISYRKPTQPVVLEEEPRFEKPIPIPRDTRDLGYTLPTPGQFTTPELYKYNPDTPTKYTFTSPTGKYNEQKTMYFPSKSALKSFVGGVRGATYQEGADYASATGTLQDGGYIPVDPMGYWNPENVGGPVIIPSTDITMQGVDQPLIGISDTGDVQYMQPGEDYSFDGEYVTEYPVAKGGISVNDADAQPLKKLDQLLNFTNYNKPTKGGWLDKYQ